MNTDENWELIIRLSQRIGELEAGGWPWHKKNIALLREARDALFVLHQASKKRVL